MESIKNLFALKKSPPKEIQNGQNEFEESEDSREQIRITYFQSGYGASTKAFGDPVTFGVGLKNLYNSFEDQCRRQINEQEKLKQPYIEEQERCRTELKKTNTAKEILDDQLISASKLIDEKKFEMIDVKQNPEKYGIDADKRPKAQFYIGLAVLFPISIYLFVFYISASYSAFFKDFETDSLTAAIFDANAFTKAIEDGWLEALFVGTLPFVFMGLGYLIHMFQKMKGWIVYVKLALLFILTFIFDVILAYLIERKIFLFDAVPGEVFTPADAIQSVNFWGIIFAGFVVYIIWGLVFDFVMKEHDNVDKIMGYIRSKKEEIKNLVAKHLDLKTKVDSLKQEATSIKGKIDELQSKINGFIFPAKKYLHYHYQYKEGWYQAINAGLALPTMEKDELRNRCEAVSIEHLEKLHLDEHDAQNIIFSNN